MYTDDPIRDFYRHDAEQDEILNRLPVCCECDYPIQSEECFEFDGEYICPGCMEENHKKYVDSLLD